MATISGLFAKPLGLLLAFLNNFLPSYGLSLIVLTIIVKACLYPLYAKQIKSMMGMQALTPKIKEIQNKYADDRGMINQKTSELYSEAGVSPYAGCWPIFVQMLVLWGLFALLRNPILYMGSSDTLLFSIHESFFWISDLSQPDKWILPIAAAIATFISFTMSTNAGTMDPSAMGGMSSQGMMKSMKVVFPLMIFVMARSYPAGLAVYWFLSQLIQIVYNLRFKRIKEDMMADQEAMKGN